MRYTTEGLARVDVLGCPPGNCHKKLLGLLADVLLNAAVKGAQPEEDALVNEETGAVLALMDCVELAVGQFPLPVIKVTV